MCQSDEMIERSCDRCGETIHVHRDADAARGPIVCDDEQGCDAFLARMVDGYLSCAGWLAFDAEGEQIDLRDGDATEDARRIAREDCADFLSHGIASMVAGVDPEQVGHDFFLTRNGHGTGFSDREHIYGEHAQHLADMARPHGEQVAISADGDTFDLS